MRNSVTPSVTWSVARLVVCLFLSFFCAFPAFAGCATYAQNGSVTDGYYLDNACTAIINNYAPCKVVTNSTGAQLFVPSYYPSASNAIGQNEWDSFLAHPPAGVSVASCSCTLPWGGSLTPGQSATAYQNSTEACHGSCTSQTRTCTCTDSSSLCVLSGSYTNQSCSVTACLPCSLPWGGSINDGQSATAYSTSTVACGSTCTGQTRSCDNGTLSGTYTNQSCTVDPCPCTLPWGGTISDGSNVTAYNSDSEACGSSCGGSNQQTRICSNGSLSGTYTNQSCTVDPCPCSATSYSWNSHCSGSVAAKSSGQSETVTNTASGYTGSVTASCTNGTWGYSGASCSANSCTLPWGGSLASGSSVTAYAASSVPYGSSCSGQTRTCTAGSLSGSYTNKTCTVQAPASCTLPWGGTLASGSSTTAYAASSVACGSSCSGQTRTCSNGSLSGSYANKTCTVQTCPTTCTVAGVSWTTGSYTCMQDESPYTLNNGQSGSVSQSRCEDGMAGGPWGSATVTCNSGSLSVSGTCSPGSCFVPGTYVLMADGSSKLIENLKVGDKVQGHTRINTVIGVPDFMNPTPIYGFNGGKPFVTGGHPFWTKNGWKAIDPSLTPKEHHNVKTTQLKVGDVLLLENGQKFVVHAINKGRKPGPHHVFDPQVDGDHTYYANGLLVHNKIKC